MLWFISALLLIWCSCRLGFRLTPHTAERFWIGLAAALLQLGTVAGLTSAVGALRPAGWMAGQVLIAGLILLSTGGFGSLTLAPSGDRIRAALSKLGPAAVSLPAWGLAMLIVSVATCALSAITQIASPIHAVDDMMYHASRVMYWIQHQTVFPFVTHNDRQTLTPFGSELLFLWPVLLTKSEVVGRIVFWLAYPLAAIGQFLLLREMALSRSAALTGVVILLQTPLIVTSAIGLKPELWSVVTLLGVAYWAVSLCRDQERTSIKCFFIGTFAILGMNIRGFPLALVPGVMLVVAWSRSPVPQGTRLRALAGGLACAGLLSGLIIPVGFNYARYGHPLGPAAVRRVVTADMSPHQMYTHLVRFPFLLAEPPDVLFPSSAAAHIERLADRVIAHSGAGAPLEHEDSSGPWPGRFTYSPTGPAQRFSIWGWFWIPTVGLASLGLARIVWSTWPRVTLTPIPALSLLAVPMLVVVLFVARWMTYSDVPGRFLIGPYALALPIGMGLFVGRLGGRRLAEAMGAIVLVFAAYQPARLQISSAVGSISSALSAAEPDTLFSDALDAIREEGRILLVGGQDAPDYGLFAPAKRYTNQVIPWGKATFDPVRMRALIETNEVTHVLVQNDARVRFGWDPDISTREMVAWLGRKPWLREIPLKRPHVRLFATDKQPQTRAQAMQTTTTPPSRPLIRIDQALRGAVGIEAASLKTPWAVEGSAAGGFLWIGPGEREGVEFSLWSQETRAVDLQLALTPGPSLASPERTVVLLANGELIGAEKTFQGETIVTFPVGLRAGPNAFKFFALDEATVNRLPNGDLRPLVVGLRDLRVMSGSGQTSAGTSPPHSDLPQRARQAAALIARRQHPRGYWLTTFTAGVTLVDPREEMNTFTTAIMTDMIGPAAADSGLGASVKAAKRFLASQVEADGLVRYNGRPDGPTIGVLGCIITPDADDTSLVWRIAPGLRPELRSTALGTLKRYRTAEGLYRTWLATPDNYQCVNKGADPNPADAVIQMHVLMMLAEADPSAAKALCLALGQAFDQDRIWVYYKKAPLLPMLRETDLQAAGCDLPLPQSRAGTAAAGQDMWMAAARLLSRALGTAGPSPSFAEAQNLLRRLADDDFASVQHTPPILYHNDLTASVRRFYWSEDFGYALWLRLWFETERDAHSGPIRHDASP
jgi:hypothetical protein